MVSLGVLGQLIKPSLVATVVGGTYTDYATHFTAANSQYLILNASTAGQPADSPKYSISLWMKLSTISTLQCILAGTFSGFKMRFVVSSGNALEVLLYDATNTQLVQFTSANTFSSNTWYHVLFSIDLTSGTVRNVWVNGSDWGTGGTWSPYTVGSNISYQYTNFEVADIANGSQIFDGELSEVWVAPGQYIDFSNSSNRALFESNSKPVSLGSTGATPTGTAPMVYLNKVYTSFQNDASGHGNNFTVNGGPLTAGTAP